MNSLTAEESKVASLIARVADDFAQCRSAGAVPDIEKYIAEHPELEDVIRQIVSSLEFINDFAGASKDGGEMRISDNRAASPSQLGEFRIVREIGRGGMGVVYEANQESLGRTVALKILPFAAGLDPMKLKRFQIETQAVATLQHPNIVQIYGTGCEQGVHYYAMEHIPGVTLDHVVAIRRQQKTSNVEKDRRSPTTSPPAAVSTSNLGKDALRSNDETFLDDIANRAQSGGCESHEVLLDEFTSMRSQDIAELGIQIADALQHAHQHGVIHRDVKPSNLILGRQNRVWITDFGLAHIGKGGALTMTGDVVGTLRYMSPEQALTDLGPIDHRTDIYSLGATLYELLTLRPLFDGTDHETLLRQMAFEEPRAPCRVDPRIPRDLETIILKAVARNRDERYSSARELAHDLQLFLEDRPIQARRPNLAQRAARWSRRHKAAVWATALLLVMASAGLLISNIAIATQRNRAESALERSKANESRAMREAAKAKAVSDVLQELLSSANPDQLKGNAYTVRQLLDNVSETLLRQLDDQPEVKATLSSIVGTSYRRLGAPKKAAPHLITALEFWRANNDENPLAYAKCLEDLAWNEAAQGRYPGAESYARESVLIRQQSNRKDVAMLHALWCLQHSLIYQAKYTEADTIAEEALKLAESFAKPPDETANILHNLAQSKNLQRKYAEGEKLARRAVEMHKQLHGKTHPETAWGLDALGRALYYQRRFAEAELVFREALDIFQQHYGSEHKSVQMTYDYLRAVLTHANDEESRARLDRDRYVESLQPLLAKNASGSTLLDILDANGHLSAAAQIVLDVPELFRDYDQCLKAADILIRYGQANTFVGANVEEEPRWITVSRDLFKTAAKSCPDDPRAMNSVAWALISNPDQRLQNTSEAIQLAEGATKTSPNNARYWKTLGVAYFRAKDFRKSTEALENSLSIESANEHVLLFLAMSLAKAGQQESALKYFEQATTMHERQTNPDAELARCYEEAKRMIYGE